MASTFYDQIGANKRNSVLLALAVVVLLGLLGLFIGWGVTGDPRAALPATAHRDRRRPRGVAGLVLPGRLARPRDVRAPARSPRRRCRSSYNVVAELALAAAVPMPRVYLIDDTAPNAFATGRDPQHASVAITTGLLQKLDREELQGVMAHELTTSATTTSGSR